MTMIPFNHPAHEFRRVDFPATPSATGKDLEHYVCQHCGLSGIRDARGESLMLNSRRVSPDMVRMCKVPPEAIRARAVVVKTQRLGTLPQNAVACLYVQPHDVPVQDREGVWVDMDGIPVMLLAGEFTPVRRRTRCAHKEKIA